MFKRKYVISIGITILVIFTVTLLGCYLLQSKKAGKGKDTFTRYELVKDWPAIPVNAGLGNPTGIAVDTSQNIVVFHRAGRTWPLIGSFPTSKIASKTILILDRKSGEIQNSWGGNYFIMPHGLTVDSHNNIWLTDVGLHQIFKFSYKGKLLMKIGEAGKAGKDALHFNRPTDVAVAKDGFYVSDGYGNNRIIKFSPAGKYLFEWGKKGDQPGEFHIPHALDLDKKGNVYVADRENKRIQVFNSSGVFLSQYIHESFSKIQALTFDKLHQQLIATDELTFLGIKHRGSDAFILDSTGEIQIRFGRSGFYNGSLCWYHDITVDNQENIYTGDILGNKIQKFKKISLPKSLVRATRSGGKKEHKSRGL